MDEYTDEYSRLNGLKHFFDEAVKGLSINGKQLFDQLDQDELDDISDGVTTTENLRQVAIDADRRNGS